MNKRSFVMGACGAALAPALMGQAAAASRGVTSHAGAARLGLEALGDAPGRGEWHAYLNEPFVLRSAGRQWPVVLDRISDLPAAVGHSQFVLGFACVAQIPSGLYRIEHASGQALMIGLNACGQGPGEPARLRAEFNRLPS